MNTSKPLRNIYEEYGAQKVNEALNYCSKEKLVTGVFPMRMASNDINIDFSSPRVTIKGLQYIESFNGEDTSADGFKEVNERVGNLENNVVNIESDVKELKAGQE